MDSNLPGRCMRIILADHNVWSRLAIKAMLEKEPGFDLVGEVDDAQGLLVLAEADSVDLVLVDRDLPGMPIDEIIASLGMLLPPPIVAVMSSDFEDSRLVLKAGADAYLSKTERSDWFLDILFKYARQIILKEAAQKKEHPDLPALSGADISPVP